MPFATESSGALTWDPAHRQSPLGPPGVLEGGVWAPGSQQRPVRSVGSSLSPPKPSPPRQQPKSRCLVPCGGSAGGAPQGRAGLLKRVGEEFTGAHRQNPAKGRAHNAPAGGAQFPLPLPRGSLDRRWEGPGRSRATPACWRPPRGPPTSASAGSVFRKLPQRNLGQPAVSSGGRLDLPKPRP